MQVTRLIPCLDVKDGRVVKGVQFLDLVDAGDPVELAAAYAQEGADEITFLDITASSDERATMLDVVERTADVVFVPLTVGGGIRSVDDARMLLRCGAEKIGVNSAAVADPGLVRDIADEFGAQCVVVAIDARRRSVRSGHSWWAHGHCARCTRLGCRGGFVGSRGDPVDLHGSRRDARRIRPRA